MNRRTKQKYGKRYHVRKIANLCDYLAKDIANNLKIFEHGTVSVPAPLCEPRAGEVTRSASEASREWHEILCKMIWSFDQFARGNPDEPFSKGVRFDSPEQKAYDKRMDEGLQLFAEWFGYLWN